MSKEKFQVAAVREITSPNGESIHLFLIGPHTALASQKPTIEEAADDADAVAISLAPLLRPYNKPIKFGNHLFTIVLDNTDWNKMESDLCADAFKTAHLEAIETVKPH